MLIMLPILLYSAIDTIEFRQVNLYEDPQGYDHEVWATWLRDTTLDTNYWGETLSVFGNYYADTVRWTGPDTLFVNTAIEVGEYNVFSLYMTSTTSPLDSIQIEYHPANVLDDFVDIPWDWRIDTTYGVYADSLIHRAVLCEPFYKWNKWRFIDQSDSGVVHIMRIYFNCKEQ